MNFMADVGSVLTTAQVEQQTIDEILTMLGDAEDSVGQGEKLKPVPASSFGASATATALEYNTGLAHSHVVDAMRDMVAALKTYTQNVKHYREDAHETDADISVVLTKNTQAVTCMGNTTTNVFQQPQTCQISSESDS